MVYAQRGNIALSTLLALSVLLSCLAFGPASPLGCTEEQKVTFNKGLSRAAKALQSVPTTFNLTGEAKAKVEGIVAAIYAYRDSPSEELFNKALGAFDALLNSGVIKLPLLARQAIQLARTVYAAFAPATLAEMSANSEDGKAARRELEENLRELERRTRQRD